MATKNFGIITLILITFLAACQDNGETQKIGKDTSRVENEIGQKHKPDSDFYDEEEDSDINTDPNEQDKNDESVVDDNIVTIEDPTDIHLVVNKQRKLPDGFIPPNLVIPNVPFSFDGWNEKKQMREIAATALEQLFEGAMNAGVDLVAVSGYRSFERQTTIYNYNVEYNGLEHAQKYSAMPGHSEHQTGLTMDVSSVAVSFNLIEDFRETSEGEWLANHAHEYGFVIRYPKGKEHITGYAYEPWHIRYVGQEAAKEIYEQQLTLEEYFGFYDSQSTEESTEEHS